MSAGLSAAHVFAPTTLTTHPSGHTQHSGVTWMRGRAGGSRATAPGKQPDGGAGVAAHHACHQAEIGVPSDPALSAPTPQS